MVNHGTGWVRMEYLVPARGLIGFRTEFLTETRGTGLLHHVFERYEPWHGELRTRRTGSLVADRRGVDATRYALIEPPGARPAAHRARRRGLRGDDRRRERPRRRHGRQPHQGEEAHQHPRRRRPTTPCALAPPRPMSLEQALEFIADDECVEVTPAVVRLRKVGPRPEHPRPPAQQRQALTAAPAAPVDRRAACTLRRA